MQFTADSTYLFGGCLFYFPPDNTASIYVPNDIGMIIERNWVYYIANSLLIE